MRLFGFVLIIGLICSCSGGLLDKQCPPDKIMENVNLLANPSEWIPKANTMVYYSGTNSLEFTSMGMQVFDTVLEVSELCRNEEYIGNDRSSNYAKTKFYVKTYTTLEQMSTIKYTVRIFPYNGVNSEDPWTYSRALHDTVLYDVLSIEYKNQKDSWDTRLFFGLGIRYYPHANFLKQYISYDTLSIDTVMFNDVYASEWIRDDNVCTPEDAEQHPGIPCNLIYKKSEGIVALQFFKELYLLKK